jgi:hypothetical protein
MRRLFVYTGLAVAALCFGLLYYTIFGPVLALAFASTCLVAAVGVVTAFERLGYGNEGLRVRRTIQWFAIFLVLWAYVEPSDRCVDQGGSWQWHSMECRFQG